MIKVRGNLIKSVETAGGHSMIICLIFLTKIYFRVSGLYDFYTLIWIIFRSLLVKVLNQSYQILPNDYTDCFCTKDKLVTVTYNSR